MRTTAIDPPGHIHFAARARTLARGAGVPLLLLVATASARAQGYSLYQASACATGRQGAAVAAPCDDGSAMFYNPAGLASTRATTAGLGATAIPPRGTFDNDAARGDMSLKARTAIVPTVYVVRPVGQGVVLGLGVFAPYGLATDWPETSEGRFISYYSSVRSVYVQPTVALRLWDRVQVGAGLDVTRTSVELRNRRDLSSVPLPGGGGATFRALGVPVGTDFADVDLKGSGTSVGGHLGVIVNATDRVSFGARYLLRQRPHFDNGKLTTAQIPTGLSLGAPVGTLPAGTPLDALVAPQFKSGQALGPQSATTALPLPDQLVAGVAVRATGQLTLLADYQFTHWSLFDKLAVNTAVAPKTTLSQEYRNTNGLRVGGEFAPSRALVLRAGFAATSAAAPDQSVTPILPDAARREYSAGLSIATFGRSTLDLAYQLVRQQDRRGRTTPDVNNGVYHLDANVAAASWHVHF